MTKKVTDTRLDKLEKSSTDEYSRDIRVIWSSTDEDDDENVIYITWDDIDGEGLT